jgi:hypothetical protein
LLLVPHVARRLRALVVESRLFHTHRPSPSSVIALAPAVGQAPLAAGERFALDLLLDLSGLLRVEGESDCVRLRVVQGDNPDDELSGLGARGWGITVAGGDLLVERQLLALVHRLAGGVAEQRSTERDRYDRVPSSENALVQQARERDPVVGEVAQAIADAVLSACGRRRALFIAPWPQGKRWAAALTHDLDVVEWWPAFTGLRLVELARKGKVGQLLSVARAAAGQLRGDPVWRGVREVLDVEARHEVRSSWFILCGSPTVGTARAGDLTYRPEGAQARRILGALRDANHEIGLHGSFATSDEPARFHEQRSRLARLAEADVDGVRQHYLRMRPGATQRDMREAGFRFDSTWGFSDRNGFRLGLADVVPAWDEANGEALPMDEAPFTWMDRALSKYRGIEDPNAWIDDAFALADRCRSVRGMFVGIWHPNLTPALGFPGAPEAYARLVAGLVERDAHLAPLGELVRWRRARRALRATMDPSGMVRLNAPALIVGGEPLRLEDAEGRLVEADVER